MALITDPDSLNQGVEIVFDAGNKTIQLLKAGNLTDEGVTGQAFYSFIKEEWNDVPALIPYPFPMVSITPEQFEFINGWRPVDDDTRYLLRLMGWREIDDNNELQKQFMNITSLGNIGAANRAYLAFVGDTAKTPFNFDGTVNQGVQVFQKADAGANPAVIGFDKRELELTTFIRTQGQVYGSSTTSSIGLTALNYIANRFPLAEAADVKITTSDIVIGSTSPYTEMSITYGAIVRDIGGDNFNFDVLIDGAQGTAEQIYEFVQYSLRQDSDIDAGSSGEIGDLADELLAFLGNFLNTRKGVYIDNFQSDDTNRIIFTDTSGTERTFPFVASGTIDCNPNLTADPDAAFHVFFTNGFGTESALLVQDNAGVDLTANIAGRASIGFDFDFDGNQQGGRQPGTDAEVTVVAIGLGSAQYVIATSTITRASGQKISLVAPLERNYTNPA